MVRGKFVKRLKLLFFVTEDWYFCSHRLPLAVAAKKAGFEVIVVTRVRGHGEVIRKAGLKLIPIEISRRGMSLWKELLTLIKLIRIYKKEKPDLIHHVAVKPVLYGSFAAWATHHKNVINAMAGMGFVFTSNRVEAKLLRPFIVLMFRILLDRSSSVLIVQNFDDYKFFKNKCNICPKKIIVIRGSGVDIDFYKPEAGELAGLPVVMLASRLLWDKGIDEFVKAAKYLRNKGVQARFVLVGDQDSQNPSEIALDEIRKWLRAGDIEWWGHKKNMSKVLNKAQIVCLPSYREGLPKVLLEAASCEKAIIAADVPGCREIVRNGKNGILVPARDSKKLAAAIKSLLDDPKKRKQMGRAGRQFVAKELSQEIIIEQVLHVYERMRARQIYSDNSLLSENRKISRKKMFFFITEDWYFCSHRLPLAIAAKEDGFDVTVVTRVRSHGDVIRSAGLRLIPFEIERQGMNPLIEFFTAFKIWKLYRKERPDIVYHVALKPILYGSFASWLVGCKNVVNAMAGKGFLFVSKRKSAKIIRPFISYVVRFLFNRVCRSLILQNSDDTLFFEKTGMIDAEKIELIRGAGVDTEEFNYTPEMSGKPVVMLASRLLWDKGIMEFVEAADSLLKQGVEARFVLVGDSDMGNPNAISSKILKSWEKSGVIEWWGYKGDMARTLSRANIVCLPSYYGEGIPKVLIEAASCGRSIITTDWPGCREIVRNGENGILVPVKDSKALAGAIKKLLAAPEDRINMGEKGREFVKQSFSLELVIKETLRVFNIAGKNDENIG